MRAQKKSNRQGLGQESKTYFKPLAKTGNQFPLQSHSQLLGSTQLAGGFLSSPLLITPARAAALQLAQIEAQLALNHLSALSISSQANGNQVALLGLLRAAATSAGSPVPMYRPQGPDFNRPRHLMPVPVNQENHAIFTDYQRPPFPPAHSEEQDVSVYQRTGAPSRHDAAQGMPFPPRPSRDVVDNTAFEDWSQYKSPNTQQVTPLPTIQQFPNLPSSTVMGHSSMPWNSARPTEDSLLPDSVSKVLASFGLNRKDLERLSQYPDSELTPEKLPAILLNLKGQNKACRVPQMTPAPAHPQVSMMPPQQSPNADPAPPTAVHPASYLSIATQVPGKVIEYGHASQEQHFIKRVPLPPPTTKCKAEPALNSKDSRSFMDDPRRPRSRSRDRSSHSPHSGKGPSSSSDWHNHSNSTGSKDHRNKYDDWKSQSHSSSRDHSSSPSRPGRHGHHSPARSTSHSQSSCSSPGRSPARHAHSRGPPPRVGERWCSPQRRSPYRHAQSHSQSPSPHHSQRLPSHPGRHRSPSPPGRRPHPHNSSSYVPTGGMSSRHFSHDRSRFPNDMSHKRAHDPRAHPSSSSPCSSLSSSSSRNSKRHSSPSLGRDRDKECDRRAAASRSTSSSQGRQSGTSDRDRSSHGRPAASASSKTDPAQSSPSGSQSAKSKAKPKASDSKPVVEMAGGKKTDPGVSVTTEKIVWAKDERGIIMISGLPESGCAESDIVTLAAPYGVPTEVIVAVAECKAVVVLPERSSAEDMVKSPASIGSCELSVELLSVSVDISRPVTLFHAMMGPDKPCGALTAWNRLLVVSNVPDSPNGPTEVEQLIQRFGNISRSLALNHNKIIVEMESAASAQAVYQRFQKFPCIVQNNPLSFSMKPDAPGVMKVQEVKSETSGSQAAAAAAVAVAASSATPPANAADQATDASSSAATDTKQPGTSSTLPAAGPTKQHPACSSPGSKDGLTESQKSTVPNGDSETTTATTATAVVTERDSKGDGGGAPTAAFDLPNVSPALLQALLQECKSRAAMKMASETKERAKDAPAEKASEEVRPEEGIPPDQEAEMKASEEARPEEGIPPDQEAEMEDNMEDDMACNMDDFVTVDEVGDFAEEASPSPGETSPVGTAEGTEDSTAMGHSPEEMDLSSEKADSSSKDTALSCEKTDACSNASDPSSEKTDPCSWEKDPSSEKKETCSQEADPSSEKTISCSKETDPSSEKSDPCSEGTDPHFKQRDVGSEKNAASSERREPCSGEEDPSCSEKVEPSSDDTLIGVLQKEESKSRTPEAVTNDVNMLDDGVPEQTEEKMETENRTDSADMDGQKDEEEEVTQQAVLDANDCLKKGGGDSDTQTTSSVTMDAIAIVAQREEAGNTTENDTAKTTTSSTPHPTGELKRRRSQNGEEVETKRLRKDPIFPKDYSLVPFNPAHPVGMEFLESRTGFFCQVCAKFYCGDEEAKRNHCRTLKHYENLEISLQHWKKRPNTGPNGTAL